MSKLKKLSIIFLCALLFVSCPVTAFAQENTTTDTEIEYLEDGSYLVTEFTVSETLTRAAAKAGTKSITYYSSKDVAQWYFEVSATFTYTGSSVNCTKADVDYKIYDNQWKIVSTSCKKSGGMATGTIKIKYTVMGIPVNTIEKSLVLTCSRDGNII